MGGRQQKAEQERRRIVEVAVAANVAKLTSVFRLMMSGEEWVTCFLALSHSLEELLQHNPTAEDFNRMLDAFARSVARARRVRFPQE